MERLKSRNNFGIILIKKVEMINEKKNIYVKDAINYANAYELLSKIENPYLDNRDMI